MLLMNIIFPPNTAGMKGNKDLQISLDNGVIKYLTLPEMSFRSGELHIDPPVMSATVRIDVLNVYTDADSGFDEITICEFLMGFVISTIRKLYEMAE